MKRVSVVGCSGSGKTTVSRRIARELGIEHVELDELHWGPDWAEATPEELRAAVEGATSAETWVVDGNYQSKIGTLVWERADTVVWVDPPRWRVIARSLRRTLWRSVSGTELWNGNRENWRGLLFWREESIVWWSWTSYPRVKDRYEAAMQDPRHRRLRFHRLRTSAEVDRFVRSLVDE